MFPCKLPAFYAAPPSHKAINFMYDLKITGAQVYDGLGNPPQQADLAVSQGKIAAIGPNLGAARETLDAQGLALMPGIIDNHTHFDAQITWDPFVTPSPALGVTTAVIGNCGFTIAPCKPGDRDLTMRNLTQVEGMSLEVLRQGIRWDFETFPQYLRALETRGLATNIAAFVGHSSVRTWVMGADASTRAAKPEEVHEMGVLVKEALAAGAIGFSTSTSPAHNGEGGLPMPSRLADDVELAALMATLTGTQGVFMLTKGGHTAIDWLEAQAKANRRPAIIAALLHNSTNPTAVFADLDKIAAANARGVSLYGAVSCCPLTNDFTMHSPYPVEGLQSWKPALGLKGQAYRAMLASRAFRDAIRTELAAPAVFRLFNAEWDKVQVVEVKFEQHRTYEQHSVGELARKAGQDPLDWMLDLALAEDLDTVFTATLLNSDQEAVGRMLNHPNSLVSLSDAGAHLTFFNDAGFGLYLLGHWARDLKAMSLTQAIKKLTHEPAQVFGLKGRGALRPGYAADLLLFDPATVARGPKQRVFDLPGGAPRLTTPAVGVHGVWVNGTRLVDEAGLRENAGLHGMLLRG
jgi:N-acyl-D-amino-acid deacylase